LPSVWPARGMLLLLAAGAFLPTLHNGFIWDDDNYITQNPLLASPHTASALRLIWLSPGATPQYYPLTHTSLLLEYKLWNKTALGYHAVSIALHAISALLLWQILRRLRLRWAWLIAAIWAVHPMQVETVAWASERKNTLSAVFYFASILAYLKAVNPIAPEYPDNFDHPRPKYLTLSIALFALGMLSKTVIATLPGALLVIAWWKRGRITPRQVATLSPMLLIAALGGATTGYMEAHVVGANGPDWQINPFLRIAIACRSLWFYATKIFWPFNYAFIYPRFPLHFDRFALGFIAATIVVGLTLLILRRRISRGPAAGAMIFAGTLLPALGLVNVYPMRFTFVADHYAYLALAPAIALIFETFFHRARSGLPALLIAPLIVLTLYRCGDFADSSTLWQATLDADPHSWMALTQLGNINLAHQQYDQAAGAFTKALEFNNDFVEAHLGLADVFVVAGYPDDAVKQARIAVSLRPLRIGPRFHFAQLLEKLNRDADARQQLSDLLAVEPRFEPARIALGRLYLNAGSLTQAHDQAQLALTQRPTSFDAALLLADVLAKSGQIDPAIGYYRQLLNQDPSNRAVVQRLQSLQPPPSTGPGH
jgi:protein O-mannosyl-transferase